MLGHLNLYVLIMFIEFQVLTVQKHNFSVELFEVFKFFYFLPHQNLGECLVELKLCF